LNKPVPPVKEAVPWTGCWVAELVDANSVSPDEKVKTKFTVTVDPLVAGTTTETIAFPYGMKLPLPERFRVVYCISPDPVTGKLSVTGLDA